MNGKTTKKAYMKWIVFGLVVALSVVWFSGCGTDSDPSKDAGTNGTVAEDQQNPDETGTTAGESDKPDGTSTDGGGGDNPTTSNEGTTTGGTGTSGTTTPADTCTIQINCNLLVGKDLSGKGLDGLVPADGVILGTTKVTLVPGDTVYDVTLRVTKAQKIHMATQGSQAMGNLYITAIHNIFEKAYSAGSGWVYLVNGTKPAVGCGVRELKAGDKLVWSYSLDYGNDL